MDQYDLTRIILSNDNSSFIMYRKFSNSIGIISTFKKINGQIVSDLNINNNRKHRLMEFYNLCAPISEYIETDNTINIDCLKNIDGSTDIFSSYSDLDSGIIHFNMSEQEVEATNDNGKIQKRALISVNPRMLIKNNYEELVVTNIKSNKFATSKIKMFPIIMIKGFIMCYVDTNESKLQLVLNKPSENLIGYALPYRNFSMINNIRTLWPIFKTDRKSNKIQISLDLPEVKFDETHPILIQLTKKIDSSETLITRLGNSLYIKN